MKKFKNALALLFSFTLLMTSFVACKTAVPNLEYPVQVGDISISSQPKEIAVLSSSIAEIVIALGFEEVITVVSEDCTQQELSKASKVTATDAQRVVDKKVSLVLAQSVSDSEKEVYSSAKIPVIEIAQTLTVDNMEEVYANIGSVLNGSSTGYNKGVEVSTSIKNSLNDILSIIPTGIEKPEIAMLIDLESKAVTGDMLASSISSFAGAKNVFADLTDGTYDLDTLQELNPQYIFCKEGLKAELENNEAFIALTAVISDQVFEVPEIYMTSGGRSVVNLALEIAGAIYPELLELNTEEPELPDSLIDDKLDDLFEMEDEVYEELFAGDTSDDIKKMQDRLFQLGYLEDTDYNGYFGDATTQAIKDFQKATGISEDGMANVKTLTSLFAMDAPKAPIDSDPENNTETSSTESSEE